MSNVKDLRDHLAVYDQEHLLRFWNTLTDDEKNELTKDINEIDFEILLAGFHEAVDNSEKISQITENNLKPVPESLYSDVNKTMPEKLQCYQDRAFRMIANTKLAVLVLAGGQGSRLGVSYPKGMYDVGLLSRKSLFQIQAERILRLEELAFKHVGQRGCIIWLVMTSGATMKSTLQFFRKHKYFGLCEYNVIIFEQFMLPAFSFDGKIILASRSKVSISPDGNGGVYRALRDRKVLDEMQERGIEYIHVYSVDNILVKVGDPLFVGYCAYHNSDCGVKVIEKTEPEEPIGVLCLVDDKWKVIEYSEISPQIAEKRDNTGALLFNTGNICNHVFSVTFLCKIAQSHINDLEFHVAKKKIATINECGEPVKPKNPNGIKLEKFIFDTCRFAEKLLVWKVNREEEFSALKNPDEVGKDCPKTVKRDLYNLHRQWIEKNGGEFQLPDIECEISPLLSYGGEDLKELVRGKSFSSPCYLKSDQELFK